MSRRAARIVIVGLLPCAAVLLRIALLVAANAGTHVFPFSWIFRPACVALAAITVLIVCFRRFAGSWQEGAVATAIFILALEFYGPAARHLQGWVGTGSGMPAAAAVFVIAAAVVSVVCARRATTPLAAIALVTLIVTAGTSATISLVERGMFRAVPAAPVVPVEVSPGKIPSRPTALPDVYIVVVDGLARADVLQQEFGVNVAPTLQRLRELGVMVPARARSNYTQTYLALASMLNGEYISRSMVADRFVQDRRPLQAMIDDAELVRRFQAAGYEFVMVSSDATMTSVHPLADRCLCVLPTGPTELEYILLAGTPFGDLFGVDRAALRAHWTYVQNAFTQIESVASSRPMLAVAHLLVPHPPFVFAADGSFNATIPRYSMLDGTQFPGTRREYIEGYGRQAEFTLRRLSVLVARLLARPRRPIIVVQSDHGSALRLVHSDPTAEGWTDRLKAFSAYAGPEGVELPPEDMTPVNAFSWAYAAATGTRWAPLPNHSFVSTYQRPYDFIEVADPLIVAQNASPHRLTRPAETGLSAVH